MEELSLGLSSLRADPAEHKRLTRPRAPGSCPEVTQLRFIPHKATAFPGLWPVGSDVLLCWDTAQPSWHWHCHKTAP